MIDSSKLIVLNTTLYFPQKFPQRLTTNSGKINCCNESFSVTTSNSSWNSLVVKTKCQPHLQHHFQRSRIHVRKEGRRKTHKTHANTTLNQELQILFCDTLISYGWETSIHTATILYISHILINCFENNYLALRELSQRKFKQKFSNYAQRKIYHEPYSVHLTQQKKLAKSNSRLKTSFNLFRITRFLTNR